MSHKNHWTFFGKLETLLSKFVYSVKNIPLPSERICKIQLIGRKAILKIRIRWKTIFQDTKKEATTNKAIDRIIIKGRQIMENVDIKLLDGMGINSKDTCFITLKIDKENFLNNSIVYLINPAKNE